MLRLRRKRLLLSRKLQEFEVENISSEMMRSDNLVDNSQTPELSFLPIEASSPINFTERIDRSLPSLIETAPVICEPPICATQPHEMSLVPMRVDPPPF